MDHHIVAETTATTAPGSDDGLKEWHMVRGDEETAMCGREIDPAGRQLSAESWGTDEAKPFCHTCGALFLREAP